jgi:hypothetical protein
MNGTHLTVIALGAAALLGLHADGIGVPVYGCRGTNI